MNKGEFVTAVADASELTKADAERAIEAMFNVVKKTLKAGDSISLVGFGTFVVRKRAARTGRNPRTNETIKIKASKVPAFKRTARLCKLRVLFRRVETRAAHRVAPPLGHWYKDRAAIQATAECPGDCGVSERRTRGEPHHACEEQSLNKACSDSIFPMRVAVP
jgi:DNA-binding protein HU-beta